MNHLKTDFLCASSSFLMGIGSTLNLQGHLYDYNASDDPDGIAIAHDWHTVGQDMRSALNKVGPEIYATKGSEGPPRK